MLAVIVYKLPMNAILTPEFLYRSNLLCPLPRVNLRIVHIDYLSSHNTCLSCECNTYRSFIATTRVVRSTEDEAHGRFCGSEDVRTERADTRRDGINHISERSNEGGQVSAKDLVGSTRISGL